MSRARDACWAAAGNFGLGIARAYGGRSCCDPSCHRLKKYCLLHRRRQQVCLERREVLVGGLRQQPEFAVASKGALRADLDAA